MRKSFLFLLSAIAVLIIVCIFLFYPKNENLKPCEIKYDHTGKEYIGNSCNVSMFSIYESGLNWLKENTGKDSKILTWYDDSLPVYFFGNRSVIILNPSEEYANSKNNYMYNYKGDYSDSDKFKDVALAYATLDINKTKEIMKKYDVDYIFLTRKEFFLGSIISNFSGISTEDCRFNVSRNDNRREIAAIGREDCFFISYDKNISSSINNTFYKIQHCVDNVIVDINMTRKTKTICSSYNQDYCEKFKEMSDKENGFYFYNYSDQNDPNNFICVNENSTMYRMLKLQIIDGFEKVYSDENVVIYKLITNN